MLIDQSCIFKYFEKNVESFFDILNISGCFFPIFESLSEQICIYVQFIPKIM